MPENQLPRESFSRASEHYYACLSHFLFDDPSDSLKARWQFSLREKLAQVGINLPFHQMIIFLWLYVGAYQKTAKIENDIYFSLKQHN